MKYPLIVKWSITDGCNLKCRHCFRSKKVSCVQRKEIDYIINDLVDNKISCVALTGGEPLTHKDFFYIVEQLYKKGIRTEIASNGLLIDDYIVSQLKKYNVNGIQISLDGANDETNDFIRGEGTFLKILDSIQLLKEEDFTITLGVTLNHRNYKQIEDFIKLKDKYKIDCLRFELYIPVNEDIHDLTLRQEDIHYISNKVNTYYDNSIIFPSLNCEEGCGAGIYMAMINTDMTISPCDLLCDEIKSSKRISEENSIKKIWNEDPVLNYWRSIPAKGCIAAIMKNDGMVDPCLEVYKSGNN